MLHTPESAAPMPVEPLVTNSGNLVVATDGTRDSDGAVRVAVALARRDGAKADVFSVVEAPQVVDLDGAPVADLEELVEIAVEERGIMLLAQRDRTHPGIHEWPYELAVGSRVDKIVDRARTTGASFILLGLGAHGIGARVSLRETALRVIRVAGLPVLALPSDAWGVPHSALAAVDFTASSEHAVRAALDLLGDDGTLYVAHVTPRLPIPQGDSRTWGEITRGAVIPKLEEVLRRLNPSPGIRVEYVHLHGDPAHEVIAFAEQMGIDMIAAGTHGRSALGRLVLGSVSTTLVRTAKCWVLVAPPHRDAPNSADRPAAPNDWS
ncbi:MAG TPA: universal stress protein [Gemmatimonadaceae bacterium]|nr:universal stress protein [Gemmatimonadaceae bacterium]